MKPVIPGSAVIASTIVLSSLIFSATPSIAETSVGGSQQPTETQKQDPSAVAPAVPAEAPVVGEIPATTVAVPKEEEFAAPPTPYVATAYSLKGRTASGRYVGKGIIAADPRHLPLGSRVRLHAGGYSGDYVVADTGGKIRGRRIDIWTPSSREAMRFGRRTVKLTVLTYGGRRSSKVKAQTR
jgi:3D (Asp-Asp-Asp) domain-containing protein